MKRSILVGIMIFACVIGISFALSVLLVDENASTGSIRDVKEIYNQYSTDVDEAVQKFISGDEYNKMSKDEQIKLVGYLLNLYEDSEIIKNLYYDESGPTYTFIYNYGNIKGALGIVPLKDWDPMMN